MDDCSSENNSFTRKSKCLSKQIQKSSNKINPRTELLSIDENNLNTEDKLNLTTKNQRLKECLIKNSSDKNLILSQHSPESHIDNLIDIVPKIDENKIPVKVKSRWTCTSQMELAVKKYSSPQTKKNTPSINNLPQTPNTVNAVLAMAVTPGRKVDKQNKTKNSVRISVEVNNHHINSENIVTMKKKRGRPKKIVIENKDETPVVFNINNEDQQVIMDKSNSSTDTKSVDIGTPIAAVKRGRGRPKKSETKPDIVLMPQTLSNTTIPKTRGRKKLAITNVNKNHKKDKRKASSNSKPPINNLKVNNENVANNTLTNNNLTVSSDSEFDESLFLDTVTIQLVRCDKPLNSNQEQDNSVSDNEQDVFDFNEVNWNIVPKKMGSKSVREESTKIQHRRNSLSDNFTFTPLNSLNVQNDFNLKKSWKSLSYLEGGPNIQIERYQQKELDKKYRSRLKRSRSFPNCKLLDTVVWRFLVYQQTYEINDCSEEISNYEMNLINELPTDGFNHHYRSKSVPIEKCEYSEMEKNTFKCKSLIDLNTLDFTSDFKTSFQVSSGCDIVNSESVREELGSKIRRSKRLNTKVKNNDILEEIFLLESSKSSRNYLQVAEEIRRENEKQLEEAKKNDPELEKKLKKLNFTLVTDNIFRPNRKDMSDFTPAEAIELRKLKHRRPIIGDTYSCNCKYTKEDWSEGKPGCGHECINRLLNIECGSGCLLKSACSNKQFQNKQFKRTQVVRTLNKGYGVFALEDIPSGTFVDEYMGEVINQHEMIKRMKKKLYRNNNYMVQLNHDEIIDATRKGNITRFINHSCEPNCVAEKWNVLGESRMGFFSKQQIHKGEEITFDYSFEIFGNTAQQKCYCGAPKCRGFISKKSKTGYFSSSSDESDDEEDISVIKPDEQEKRKKIKIKKITNKDKKRLQELDQQLTDISRLKNKNRSDLENSTLNLNKLMVHITDSMSRSHILKFIRENDLNCKKLFMNFNGLSIVHSWMISNNNESLKLEIIKTLSDLPISNRNTITKSKVIDIVAEWAKIPSNIKETIENLKYPETKSTEHRQEIEKLLPNEKNISQLAQEARILWKKWITLRMLFKIPKLDRPKEVQIPNIICKPPIILSSLKRKTDQYHFGNPMIPSQPSKVNHEHIKNKFKHVKYEPSKGTPDNFKNKTNSIETFSKMINHHNQKNNLDKCKAVLEWNKKQLQHTECTFKTNNTDKVNSSAKIQDSNPFVLNTKRVPAFKLKAKIQHQEIPTIETTTFNKNIKWNNITEFNPAVYEVPANEPVQSVSANNIIDESVYYPIESVNLELPPLTLSDIREKSILTTMFQVAPPKFSKKWSNIFKVTNGVASAKSSCVMTPDDMSYDELHPSIEEQYAFMSSQSSIQNPNHILIDTSYTKPTITESNNNNMAIVKEPLNENVRRRLLKQCKDNLQKLKDKGILDILKSSKQNYIDQSPMKIPQSFFKKKLSISRLQQKNDNSQLNFFKCLKIASNCYREQPSLLIKINKLKDKSILPQNKNDIFRIKEKQTVKCDTASLALKLCNEQLSAVPQSFNIKKLLTNKTIEQKIENKFACKILNGYMKKFSAMPISFIIKSPLDTKITTLDPVKELELYHKLIPTVSNTLCAKLKDGDKDTVNVFKQKITLKYDESKPIIRLESMLKESSDFLKTIEENIHIPKVPKRKLPLPPVENVKIRKVAKSIKNNGLGGKNYVTETNQLKDSEIFKKPLPPTHHKNHGNKYFNIKNKIDCPRRDPRISSSITPSITPLKRKANEFRQKPSTSRDLIKIDENEEARQKPLMKCSPFNKVDNISATELEQNVKMLATSLSLNYSADLLPSTSSNSELIKPIVESFKNSITLNNSNSLFKDDPIVQEFKKHKAVLTELNVRKYKLPESMMSLPVEVLNLVPDNPKDIKHVLEFYHSMATVIVKVLDPYVKKSCKQGRIKSDEDFKYLAKKLNSNILYKELQVKKAEDLRISESVKLKVGQYIKTYMCKYGKLYRRKTTDL